MQQINTVYQQEKADQYEEQSRFDKGNREIHRNYLVDTISHFKVSPASFLDLGCGTGYFAEAIFEAFPSTRGILIDGSTHMIELASRRLLGKSYDVRFNCNLLEDIDWSSMGSPAVIFSSLTIHFLEDTEKWKLFAKIHHALPEGGVFILFDQFDPKEKRWSLLLEYLACNDLKRRVQYEMQIDFELDELKIDSLIQKARMTKIQDQEKDASLEDHVTQLKAAGFDSVCMLFQETRFFGLVTIK